MEAKTSKHPELLGIHLSYNDQYVHFSPFSSPVYKRRLEISGHLVKRTQTCSINGAGQAYTCPDNWHCTGDFSCEQDSWNHWWGAGIGAVVVVILITLVVIKRRRGVQRQQSAFGQASMVVPATGLSESGPGYDHGDQYGRPIPLEPLRQPAMVYAVQDHVSQEHPRMFCAPLSPPPPRSIEQTEDRVEFGSSSSAPPEYSPSYNLNDSSNGKN